MSEAAAAPPPVAPPEVPMVRGMAGGGVVVSGQRSEGALVFAAPRSPWWMVGVVGGMLLLLFSVPVVWSLWSGQFNLLSGLGALMLALVLAFGAVEVDRYEFHWGKGRYRARRRLACGLWRDREGPLSELQGVAVGARKEALSGTKPFFRPRSSAWQSVAPDALQEALVALPRPSRGHRWHSSLELVLASGASWPIFVSGGHGWVWGQGSGELHSLAEWADLLNQALRQEAMG